MFEPLSGAANACRSRKNNSFPTSNPFLACFLEYMVGFSYHLREGCPLVTHLQMVSEHKPPRHLLHEKNGFEENKEFTLLRTVMYDGEERPRIVRLSPIHSPSKTNREYKLFSFSLPSPMNLSFVEADCGGWRSPARATAARDK